MDASPNSHEEKCLCKFSTKNLQFAERTFYIGSALTRITKVKVLFRVGIVLSKEIAAAISEHSIYIHRRLERF